MTHPGRSYGDVRDQAAQAAYAHIRHLLYPETVYLLSVKDVAEAVAVASDILAPADNQAMQRLGDLEREVDQHRRQQLTLLQERDEALGVADDLAFAVAALVGDDIGRRDGRNNPWQRALNILDEIAEANGRPRPSDLQYGRAA